MVHIKPHSTPKLSLRTLTIGARQLVVHDALESVFSFPVRTLSLTPMTIVASRSPLAGADRMTFLAPDTARCFSSDSRLVKMPVDSKTISTSLHGMSGILGVACIAMRFPLTTRVLSSTAISPLKRPCTESYLSR